MPVRHIYESHQVNIIRWPSPDFLHIFSEASVDPLKPAIQSRVMQLDSEVEQASQKAPPGLCISKAHDQVINGNDVRGTNPRGWGAGVAGWQNPVKIPIWNDIQVGSHTSPVYRFPI